MTKQKLLLYLLFLMGMVQGAMAQEKEPYAVLSDNNTVLTFYYDTQKAERKGKSVGPFEFNYWDSKATTSWYSERQSIATVVFDASFADCTSLTSTAYWFYKCYNLTTITGIDNLKTDNVTDMSCMFAYCSGLTSLDVSGFKTDNVTSIHGMFSGCSGLTSLDVSGFKTDNVKSMGGMFYGCSGLTSLDLSGFKTDNVTSMHGMFDSCSGLTSLDVSGFKTDNVTSMHGMFAYCSGLTSLDVSGFNTANVTTMGFMFGYCSSLTSLDLSGFKTDNVSSTWCMFKECTNLTTIYASHDWTIKAGDGDMFTDCINLVGGNGTAYDISHNSSDYARIDKPGQPGYFTSIFSAGSAITLNVTDDEGKYITQNVSIVWYGGDGKQIGTGSRLYGVAEDAEVYYSVLLPEALGRVYREVNMRPADADEDGVVTCQLEKIGRVTLEGRVSATDIEKTTATVSVQQMLNGKWAQEYTTQTDKQGLFSVEVYDDVTDITISGDGYLDATLHRDGFGGSGNVGTIPVSLLTGFAVAANISMEKAVETGEAAEVTAWTDGLTNIDFALTNLTKGTALNDIAVQGGSVVIKSGAAVGDVISLKAMSKQGVFADAETNFTIAEGANSFDLQLTELGGVDATCAATSNGTTVGYLYDHNDLLAARGSYRGETLSLRHLKNGTYTLVSMGQSLLLGSMTSLADLNAVGLSEGTDYVTTRIDVVDGEVATVSVSDVPQLDETPFYYTTSNTYFNTNKASVMPGDYLTLRSHVDFKPEHADKADGVTLTIDLPEGCRMVENSVIANRQAVPHTVSGNRVAMTLNKDQYESEVRFCVIPTQNQNYTVTAMASFDIDGQVQQPIGTAQFEANGLSLSAPKLTASTTVTINGTAKGHSEVSIYDNDVFVGTTTSKANGSWTAQCELYKPYSHSFHDIYAKITTDDGMELTSETKQVEYDKTNIVPSSVMMAYYNGWYKTNIDVTFDLLNGTSSRSSYPFYHGTDFTFLADFTRNDSTVVKNVNIKVLNSDGTVRTLPATFDGNQGKWVATTKYYSASRLPQNVTVEYDLIPSVISDEEREEALQEQANALASSASVISDFFDNKTEMTLVEEGDDYALFECRTSQDAAPMFYRIENIDYQVADGMMKEKQFVYTEGEDNIIGTYTEITDGGVTVYVVDVQNNAACKMCLYVNTVSGVRASANTGQNEAIEDAINALQESVGSGRFLAGFLEHFGNLVDLINLFTDLKEYWSVRGDFDNMCNVILNYSDNLEKVNKRTFDMTLAKCPDGSYRLSKEDMDKFYKAIQATANTESAFMEQYFLCLQEYKTKLGLSVLTFVGTLGLGKAIGALGKSRKFVSWKVNMWFYNNLNKHFSSYVFRTTSAKILSSVIGTGIGAAVGWGTNKLDEIFSYKDFSGVKDRTLLWASSEYTNFLRNYVDLQKAIRKDYKKCEKDEDEKQDEPLDKNSDNNVDFKGQGSTPIIDPSGYVYEAVLSNRLEGVTTTCYEQVNGEAVLWNAEDYSQQNPLKTDATGFYRWDVPQGMWQVKYEKEGYETAYSEWLPVPPPQLDVNIGMKQSTTPTVKQMRGYEEGITVEMGKYMRPETMTAERITVTRNGSPESGTVELLNTEQAPLGEEQYVSKVRFVPESRFNSTDQVVVTVHKEVESYCGVPMTADHVETVKIEAEVKHIVADSAVTVPYQGERELRVVVLPKDAAASKTLRARSSSQMIASVSATEVKIGQDGVAVLTLGGELPGGAVVDFSIDGSDVTTATKVQVAMGRDMVSTPTASIATGEIVSSGTMLTLSCATEGTTIYYTLDGSCPCDETTRKKYEAPIVITESAVVKAIAVKDDMDDSDVATFIYIVDAGTGVKGIGGGGADIAVRYEDGVLVVTGAEGCAVRVYDLLGRELGARRSAVGTVSLTVPKAEGYIVSITTSDGHTVVRKVMRN